MALEILSPNDLTPCLHAELTDFFGSQNTSHPFQLPQWAGPGSHFALLRLRGKIRWFAQYDPIFPLGARVSWLRAGIVNRGPICDDPDLWKTTLNDFKEQCQREQFIYIEAAPDHLAQQAAFGDGWEPAGYTRSSLRLDLTKPEEDIFAQLRKSTRYEIRRAERVPVSVESARSSADLEEFLDLYFRLASRKNFSPDSRQHMRSIIQWLQADPHWGRLLLARHSGVVVAGAVLVRCARRCWYVWGASEKRSDFSAGHLLQWQAILWAKSHACTQYDFGGYTPGATAGPAFFKEGFGGDVVQFLPAHRAILRRGYYKMFELISEIKIRSRHGRRLLAASP